MKILISWIQRVSTNAPPKELRAGTWDLGGVSHLKKDIYIYNPHPETIHLHFGASQMVPSPSFSNFVWLLF